jgi:hypothetical protein
MSLFPASRASLWLLSSLALARCSGTEADNPLTDIVATPCKSSDAYDPEQLTRDLDRLRRAPGDAFAALAQRGAPLTRQDEIPEALRCVEWQVTDGALELQVVNFSAGCSVEWQATASVQAGRVSLLLDSPSCEVARCAGCLYDTAASIPLPAVADTELALRLTQCQGPAVVHEWSLPLLTERHGFSCDYSDAEGGAEGSVFARCDSSVGSSACGAGLSCSPVGKGASRCLQACVDDTECPVAGATRCEGGQCVPRAPR